MTPQKKKRPYEAAQEFRPGDWECVRCKEHNFNGRIACRNCGFPIASEIAGGDPQQQHLLMARWRKGDWQCIDCKSHNWMKKDQCGGCGSLKNRTTVSNSTGIKKVARKPRSFREGDWACVLCQHPNDPAQESCELCQLPRGSDSNEQLALAAIWKPGDWLCLGCQTHNFAVRTRCTICNLNKTCTQAELDDRDMWIEYWKCEDRKKAREAAMKLVEPRSDEWITNDNLPPPPPPMHARQVPPPPFRRTPPPVRLDPLHVETPWPERNSRRFRQGISEPVIPPPPPEIIPPPPPRMTVIVPRARFAENLESRTFATGTVKPAGVASASGWSTTNATSWMTNATNVTPTAPGWSTTTIANSQPHIDDSARFRIAAAFFRAPNGIPANMRS